MDIYVVVFGRSEGYLKAYTSVHDAVTYIQTNFYQDDEIVGAEEIENYGDYHVYYTNRNGEKVPTKYMIIKDKLD